MLAAIAIAANALTATPAIVADWYADQICKSFPDDLCSDWRVLSVEACDDDGETACVVATHPTAWGGVPSRWTFVFDSGDNLAIGAVYQAGRFQRVIEG